MTHKGEIKIIKYKLKIKKQHVFCDFQNSNRNTANCHFTTFENSHHAKRPCHELYRRISHEIKQNRNGSLKTNYQKTTHQAFKLPIRFTVIYWLYPDNLNSGSNPDLFLYQVALYVLYADNKNEYLMDIFFQTITRISWHIFQHTAAFIDLA